MATVAAVAMAVSVAPAAVAVVAAPEIGGTDDLEYLVGSGDELLLPDVTIGDGNYADGAFEVRLPGASADEALSLLEADEPSTVEGEVSVVDGRIYQGRDGEAVEIASAAVTRTGGAVVLQIGFASPLENNDFAIVDEHGWPEGWTVQGAARPGVTASPIVLGDLASRTQASRTQPGATHCAGTSGPIVPGCVRIAAASGGGYTVTGIDARSSQPYEFWTDFHYNPNAGQGGWGHNGQAWSREGDERTTAYYNGQVSVTPGVLQFSSNATCVQTNPTYSSYCSNFGPEAWSPVFEAEAGQALSFDWTAQLISDDYEIYAYLVEVPDATTLPTAASTHSVLAYGRGANQPWTTTSGVIPEDGQYRFRFVNGSYDRTGGYALGSRLSIRNVRVVSAAVEPDVVEQIARLVQYRNDDVELVDAYGRQVQLSLTDRDGQTGTGGLTIDVLPDPDVATITTQPGASVAGESVTGAPTVAVVRESGAIVVGRQVTAVLEGDGSFAAGSTTTVATDADGNAVFDDLVVHAAGDYTIRFVIRGQDVDTSASFTVAPAAVDVALTTIEVSDADVDAGGTVTVTARFWDRFGNPTSDATQGLTLTTDLGVFPGGGTSITRDDLVEDPAGVFTTTLSLPRAGTATISGDGVTDTASVTVEPRPAGAPSDLEVERGDGQAQVSWTAPDDDGGTSIVGYLVEQSTDGGATWTTVVADTGSDATSVTVIGLDNGTSYRFRATAITAAGSGTASAGSPTVVPATVPDAPSELTATFGDREVTLSWTAPAFDGGNDVAGYLVEVSEDDGVTWTTAIADTGSDATSVTVDGLVNGRDYRFRVTAINDVGAGAVGSVSDAVRPRTVPGAPTALEVTAGEAEVALSWTAPDDAGGAAVSGYRVEVSTDAGASWSTAIADTGSDATSVTVDGLIDGTSYRFRVTAINEVGSGAVGTVSDAVVPFTVPDAPTGLVEVAGDGEVLLSWRAPAFDGGSEITGYRVEVSDDDGDSWSTAIANTGSASASATVDGLDNGRSYAFRVTAINARGAGDVSDVSGTVTPFTVPDVVSAVTVDAGDGEVSLSWQVPAFDGGSAITGYRVEGSDDGGESWSAAIASTGSDATSVTVDGLINGRDYRFRVAAINARGASTVSEVSDLVVPFTVPDAPTGVVGVRGDGEVSLSWQAPSFDGGRPVTGYLVEVSSNDGASWSTAIADTGSDATSATISELSNGADYRFRVTAINARGASLVSEASATVVPFTVPGTPRGLTASYGDGQVSLTWQQPIATGGNQISGYLVEVSTDGGQTWTVAIADTGSAVPQATVDGLVNGNAYQFRVSAINAAGPGVAGGSSVAVTPRTTPTVAEVGAVVVSSRGVSFEVGAPAEDGGSPITGYEYSLDGGVTWQVLPGAPGRVELDGLRNHVGYELLVRAVNAEGVGPATAMVTVTPQPAPAPVEQMPTPGRPFTTVDGQPVDATRTVIGGRTVDLAAGGTSVAITGRDGAQTPVRVDTDGRVRTREGGSLSVAGGGFAPGSDVDVWLLPSGQLLGEVAVNAFGVVTGTFTLPDGLAPGTYVLQVTGVAADGSLVSYTLVVEVQGPFVPSSTDERCLPTAATAPDFDDIDGSAHRANIRCMAAHGLTEGVRGGDAYAPGGPVTRAQMASFIARFLERTSGSQLPREASFGDVDGGPHAANIEKLATIGVVVGIGDGTDYAPNAPVTRAQMASFVHRALSWLDGDVTTGVLPRDAEARFSDLGVSGVHAGNVQSLAGVGIVVGYEDGTYRPGDAVTRAQMASYVMRAYAWASYELGITR